MSAVAGLDLSLNATGVATPAGEALTIRPQTTGMARLAVIETAVVQECTGADLVIIEGYAQGSPYRAHALGEVGGVVRLALWRAGIEWLAVPPTRLKKYASGNGKADKAVMLAAARERLGYRGWSHDEADAWVARAFGLALLGQPVAELPKAHTEAVPVVRTQLPEGLVP